MIQTIFLLYRPTIEASWSHYITGKQSEYILISTHLHVRRSGSRIEETGSCPAATLRSSQHSASNILSPFDRLCSFPFTSHFLCAVIEVSSREKKTIVVMVRIAVHLFSTNPRTPPKLSVPYEKDIAIRPQDRMKTYGKGSNREEPII